jgi:hypothetical protein
MFKCMYVPPQRGLLLHSLGAPQQQSPTRHRTNMTFGDGAGGGGVGGGGGDVGVPRVPFLNRIACLASSARKRHKGLDPTRILLWCCTSMGSPRISQHTAAAALVVVLVVVVLVAVLVVV